MAADKAIIWEGLEDRFDASQTALCKKCGNREDPIGA